MRMRTPLLLKRFGEYLLFAYVAGVLSFLQFDTRLFCDVVRRARAAAWGCGLLLAAVVVAAASFAIVYATFRDRYLLRKHAAGAAAIFFASFWLCAAAGLWLRLRIAPAENCDAGGSIGFLVMAVLTAMASSIFIAAYNLVATQKPDYADLRVRIARYVDAAEDGHFKDVPDLLTKASDSAAKTMASESPRYAEFVRERVEVPLRTLSAAAEETVGDEGAFFARIGLESPGTIDREKIIAATDAHRALRKIVK